MAERSTQLFTNRVVILIATLLALGILLDGTAYNRSPLQQSIYSISDARSITISQRNQIIMAFEKQADQWLFTKPTSAPASSQRVQVLIDSNNQTQRSYAASQLPTDDLFADAIQVEIDDNLFLLGDLEPVSKLRYVMANNNVYLQADHVIPMLRAGSSAFIDLAVTSVVKSVSIDSEIQPNADLWSGIAALGIIPKDNITAEPHAAIVIEEHQNTKKHLQVYYQEGTSILAPVNSRFGYLLSSQQAFELGLTTHN